MASHNRFADAVLLMLPDCEGLLEDGSCRWLKVDRCQGKYCPSYRRRGEQTEADSRLRSLDDELQERIAKKYYHGRRPWAEKDFNRER